jgi:hypothetical protein
MREGEYEYIHEFKERIDEILSLQKKHHEIIDNNEDNPQIQQTSLAELHRLNITLSNYFDVAPTIVNGITLQTTPSETKDTKREVEREFYCVTYGQNKKIRGLFLRSDYCIGRTYFHLRVCCRITRWATSTICRYLSNRRPYFSGYWSTDVLLGI